MEEFEEGVLDVFGDAELDELLNEAEKQELLLFSEETDLVEFDTGENVSGAVVPEESLKVSQARKTTVVKRKDPRNRERCRQARLRKKERFKQEQDENISLKRDRSTLLKEIANLEMEVQGLRGANAVDLKKENDLLEKEVKRYKQYVDRIVSLTRDAIDFSKSETVLALETGISSSVGQIVGIAYSSLADSSWRKGQDMDLKHNIQGQFSYQLLPIGSTMLDAKRLCIRVDMKNIGRSAKEVAAVIERGNLNKEGIKEFYSVTLCESNGYELVSVFPRNNTKYITLHVQLYSSDSDSCHGNTKCWRIVTDCRCLHCRFFFCIYSSFVSANPKRELTYACSSTSANLFPAAFNDGDDAPDSFREYRTHMIVNTTAGTKPEPSSSTNSKVVEGIWL